MHGLNVIRVWLCFLWLMLWSRGVYGWGWGVIYVGMFRLGRQKWDYVCLCVSFNCNAFLVSLYISNRSRVFNLCPFFSICRGQQLKYTFPTRKYTHIYYNTSYNRSHRLYIAIFLYYRKTSTLIYDTAKKARNTTSFHTKK
jgi:hypothetical protein